jgi:hypothetical protein
MAYYPKNKIKTNLYTSGGEFIIFNTKEKYIGPYHKLYNGKFFTGTTPNSLNSLELIPVIEPASDEDSDLAFQSQLKYPQLFPTPQDYKNGEFIRYFIVKRNEYLFTEVSKKEHDKYKNKQPDVYWRLFKPVSLFWVLTGDINQVAQTNKKVTEFTETKENVLGLSIYLKEDWTQYYKANP